MIGDLVTFWNAIHPHIDNIWKDIVHQAFQRYGISLDFIHYDITSLYFEGEYEDADLVDYGYSRDDKSDCKQVNLRLNITDEYGIPIAYKVINGKTADRTTPMENMAALRELLAAMPESNDIIIISDQGMLDRDVIIQYHQQNIGYLGPLPTLKEYDDVLMSVTTAQLKEHPLEYRPRNQKADEPAVYYGVSSKVKITGKKVEGTVETNALILYSANKAKLDEGKRNTLLKRYLERLGAIQKRINVRRYKKAEYVREQLGKAQRKYPSVQQLIDKQLIGEDGQLSLTFSVNSESVMDVIFWQAIEICQMRICYPISKVRTGLRSTSETSKALFVCVPYSCIIRNVLSLWFSYVCWHYWCFLYWKCRLNGIILS
jgi:transposase